MQNKGPYYLTTAIAYTSSKPHIGNNYEIVLADSIVRFKRKEGYDVYFQTGTDEHGQKIELKAQEAGVTPKEYVDKIAGVIKRICAICSIFPTTNLSGQRMITMRSRYRKFLSACMIREIFTREPMRECTVRPASPSGQNPSL